MTRKQPLTARQAALEGVRANQLPFNRSADQRHALASFFRLARETAGLDDSPADDESPDEDADSLDESGSPQAPDASNGPTSLVFDSGAESDASSPAGMSLADIVRADYAASYDFPRSPATSSDERQPLGPPSTDFAADSDWVTDDSTSLAADDQSLWAPSIRADDADNNASFSPSMGLVGDSSPTPNWRPLPSHFKAPFGGWNPSRAQPVFRDALFRYGDPVSPPKQLPYRPSEELSGPLVELLSDGPSTANAPITAAGSDFSHFGVSDSEPNSATTSPVKRQYEFESSPPDFQKDAVLAFLELEEGFLKLIDQASEQDRADAFARAASMRACS